MRLTPAQGAVILICGEPLPSLARTPDDMHKRLRMGHDLLVRLTSQNFGYDLQAWHDYLKESRDGGYTYGRNIDLPKIMKAALASPEWHATAARLARQNPH
jgi:hypothetical protein